MQQPSHWGITFRRVEEFFKKFITTGQCLCPLDSYIYCSAPWPCIVCVDIRRRLRGEPVPRNCVITGGKRRNERGVNTAWIMSERVPCGECGQLKWQYPHPYTMLATAWLVLKRNLLRKTVGFQLNVTPIGLVKNDDRVGVTLHVDDSITGNSKDYNVYHPMIKIKINEAPA